MTGILSYARSSIYTRVKPEGIFNDAQAHLAAERHERVWLAPKDREAAREMRLRAGQAGLRAPVQVMEGNYKLMSGTCAWWDGVRKT